MFTYGNFRPPRWTHIPFVANELPRLVWPEMFVPFFRTQHSPEYPQNDPKYPIFPNLNHRYPSQSPKVVQKSSKNEKSWVFWTKLYVSRRVYGCSLFGNMLSRGSRDTKMPKVCQKYVPKSQIPERNCFWYFFVPLSQINNFLSFAKGTWTLDFVKSHKVRIPGRFRVSPSGIWTLKYPIWNVFEVSRGIRDTQEKCVFWLQRNTIQKKCSIWINKIF